MLGPKIEGLPDDSHPKLRCLLHLAQLFTSVGNYVECKRLLSHVLELRRKQNICKRFLIAGILKTLSSTNLQLGLYAEGIQQAKQAIRINKWTFNTSEQAITWEILARLLHADGQLDAAQEAVSQAINLLPGKGEEFIVCQCYALLGQIHQSEGEMDTALAHFETALRITSPFNWHNQRSGIHHYLAELLSEQGKFNEANGHIEHAKLHAANNIYSLGCTIYLQAEIWYKEQRFGEAKSEVLHAVAIFEELGAAEMLGGCEELLNYIEEGMHEWATASGSGSGGKLLGTVQPPLSVDPPPAAGPSRSN